MSADPNQLPTPPGSETALHTDLSDHSEQRSIGGTVLSTMDFSVRLFTGVFVFIYGAAKPWQFIHYAEYDVSVNEMEGLVGFNMMWYFFAHSRILPTIIGVFECTGAVMLCFNRTKLIAAATLVPVLSVIVLLDTVYVVHAFATANAIAYLLVCLYVLFAERTKVTTAMGKLVITDADIPTRFTMRRIILLFALFVFFSITMIFIHWVAA